jgi:hypothetical protein
MKNIFICQKHVNELVFKWKSNQNPKHILKKQITRVKKNACTVPNNKPLDKHQLDSNSPVATSGLFLSKDMAEAYLRKMGIHIHPGIRKIY